MSLFEDKQEDIFGGVQDLLVPGGAGTNQGFQNFANAILYSFEF